MFIDELKKLIENLKETQVVTLTINADLEYYIPPNAFIVLEDGYIVVRELVRDYEEILFMIKQDSIIAVSVRTINEYEL